MVGFRVEVVLGSCNGLLGDGGDEEADPGETLPHARLDASDWASTTLLLTARRGFYSKSIVEKGKEHCLGLGEDMNVTGGDWLDGWPAPGVLGKASLEKTR